MNLGGNDTMPAKKTAKQPATSPSKTVINEKSSPPTARSAENPAVKTGTHEVKKKFEVTRAIPSFWSLEAHNFKYDTRYLQYYVDHLKQKKIVGVRCPCCRIVFVPPKPVCGRCHERTRDWVEVSEYATVVSFSAGYEKKKSEMREDIAAKPVPVVAVKHDGADSAYIALLTPGLELDQVYVGMRVKVVWNEKLTGTLSDIKWYEPVPPL